MASSRPKQRYLVGSDARAISLYNTVVPGALKDRLASLALGL